MHEQLTRCRIAGYTGVALAGIGSTLTTAAYGRPQREQIYLAGLTCLLGACSAGLAALAIGARDRQEAEAEQIKRIGGAVLVTIRDDLEPHRQRRTS